MSLWEKSRQGRVEAITPQPVVSGVTKSDTGRSLTIYEVEPPLVTRLGDHDWLPPAWRGLEVYHPMPNWELAGRAPMASSKPTTKSLGGGGTSCARCGYNLMWEPIGNPTARYCCECDPPSPRMTENVWLVECEDIERCVSDEQRWLRVAFQVHDSKPKRAGLPASSDF